MKMMGYACRKSGKALAPSFLEARQEETTSMRRIRVRLLEMTPAISASVRSRVKYPETLRDPLAATENPPAIPRNLLSARQNPVSMPENPLATARYSLSSGGNCRSSRGNLVACPRKLRAAARNSCALAEKSLPSERLTSPERR